MSVFGKAAALFIPRKTQDPVAQPGYGTDMRAIEAWAENVIVQLTAGSNITLTPSSGTGPVVEIAATGGGGGGYASLTGPGETTSPGDLTQEGNLTVQNVSHLLIDVSGSTTTIGAVNDLLIQAVAGLHSLTLTSADLTTVSATTETDIDAPQVFIRGDFSTAGNGAFIIGHDVSIDSVNLGFFGGGSVPRQTVTGSRGGNAALASLLTALNNSSLIIDSSTP